MGMTRTPVGRGSERDRVPAARGQPWSSCANLLRPSRRAGSGEARPCGHPRQLPEIDAGRAFRGPATRLGVDELADNRRRYCEWECTADSELCSGSAPAALEADREHGQVVAGTSVDAARAWLVQN